MPRDGTVTLRTVTTEIGVLTLTGPSSRAVLERVSGRSMSSSDCPYLTWCEIPIGRILSWALRVAYSGELGWELHMPVETLREAYLTLQQAGQEFGITDVGYRALESLGLEKGYLALGADLTREYNPLEAGLERLLRIEKGPFVGRDALQRQRTAPIGKRLAWLLLDPGAEVMPSGMEPILQNGEVIGFTVRAAYGYRIGRPIVAAYLPPEIFREPGGLTVEILGELYPASLTIRAPYDPQNVRREGAKQLV
jgi:glycine cleavage system aminomethyltransferase T